MEHKGLNVWQQFCEHEMFLPILSPAFLLGRITLPTAFNQEKYMFTYVTMSYILGGTRIASYSTTEVPPILP